jgi:hypothetical protein
MYINVARLGVLCLVLTILPACAMFSGGNGNPAHFPESIRAEKEQHEATVRVLIERTLREAQAVNTASTAQLVFGKPYFFKEYVEYPEGIEDYALDIQDSDSKSTSYTAHVRLPKKRFSTELEKKKAKARRDTSFYESTGIETRSFEMRHGHWRETGSVFIAHESEARVLTSSQAEESTEADVATESE